MQDQDKLHLSSRLMNIQARVAEFTSAGTPLLAGISARFHIRICADKLPLRMPSIRLKACLLVTAALCCLQPLVARGQAIDPKSGFSAMTAGWAEISNTLGFPLGGIGTGYSAFGKYGFVHVNFDGRARDVLNGLTPGEWEYTAEAARSSAAANLSEATERRKSALAARVPPAGAALAKLDRSVDEAHHLVGKVSSPSGFVPSTFGFVLREGKTIKVLQTNQAPWLKEASTFEHAETRALLPRGEVIFTENGSGTRVRVDAFTPLLPHNLHTSTVPVQVIDVTVENMSRIKRSITLSLENSVMGQPVDGRPGTLIFKSGTGELSFATVGGQVGAKAVTIPLKIAPKSSKTQRFYIAWYYPKVDRYLRQYTRSFPGASAVLDLAAAQADSWLRGIDAWHASVDVPAPLKRLWFGSLSAVETSTILTTDPLFLEVETPHNFYNTMDVFVYANWVYMINWPELERMDMDQYLSTIPKNGPDTGLVLHSIWKDSADYVEEPTFLVRMRRDALWYNDPAWTRKGYDDSVLAANHVFALDHQDGLIVSKRGNQSYDVWKMPGISSYVNSAWIYGLNALKAMQESLHETTPNVGSEPVDQLLQTAQASYDRYLWNAAHGDWNVFYRTPGASSGSLPDSLFTDQLFGRWVMAIDPKSEGILPDSKIHSAVLALYKNNAVEDPAHYFRGWVDGMQYGHVPDLSGRHSRTFWIGPQINLASLLGMEKEEAASLDVMESVERSLGPNVLAAGEWNKALNAKGEVELLPDEPAKDSPRFAPYPRYSSAWEYLIRIVGLQMDERTISLKPFRTISFNLNGVQLAGMDLTIHVQTGWTRAEVDHKPVPLPVALDRSTKHHDVQFLK